MNIPLPPGVPPLLKPTLTINGITNVVNTAALLIADSKLIASLLNPPKWGLYKGGALVVQADSVINMAYRQDSKISDYPQEEGLVPAVQQSRQSLRRASSAFQGWHRGGAIHLPRGA